MREKARSPKKGPAKEAPRKKGATKASPTKVTSRARTTAASKGEAVATAKVRTRKKVVRDAAAVALEEAPTIVSSGHAREAFAKLRALHPDAHCELLHRNAFELLCATVLSAQTTDVAVNKVTPALFAAFPTAEAMAKAEPLEVEPYVSTLGFFRMKAKNLVGLARLLVERHGGKVPQSLDALVKLPGVGRKTANVVLGVMWNAPEGVVVDTHVQRLSQRLGWTFHSDPAKIEQDLSLLLPRDQWDAASHTLIFHGRRVCFAIKPNCAECGVSDLCPSAFRADGVGRKPPKRAKTTLA